MNNAVSLNTQNFTKGIVLQRYRGATVAPGSFFENKDNEGNITFYELYPNPIRGFVLSEPLIVYDDEGQEDIPELIPL